jgi:hypothetical protein
MVMNKTACRVTPRMPTNAVVRRQGGSFRVANVVVGFAPGDARECGHDHREHRHPCYDFSHCLSPSPRVPGKPQQTIQGNADKPLNVTLQWGSKPEWIK